jgi:O-antigen/teichoic acid export membrane protein
MRLTGILFGHGTTAALTLGRNLAAATLLPLSDYGLAATFFIVIALVEMLTQFGQSVLVVADQHAEREGALERYHAFNLLRGSVAAVLLVIGALVLAPTSERWLYILLALVPTIGALQHFGPYQRQRSGRTGQAVAIPVIAALVSFAVLFGAALVRRDASIVLAALLAQALVAMALSHLLSQTRYRLQFDRVGLSEQFRAGLPLLMNGILLFLVLFGERLVVGQVLGREALGVFAMGVTLTLTPSIILSKSLMTHYLPLLVRNGAMMHRILVSHGAAALLLALVLALEAPPVATLALPAAFAPLALLLPLMALQQGLRLAKGAQAVFGIASGFRSDEIAVSAVRIAALPIAWHLALAGHGMLGVLWAGVLGESVALLVAGLFLRVRMRAAKLRQGAPVKTPLLLSGESS